MRVVSVSLSGVHGFSKDTVQEIEIVAGLGVRGDAHAGATVQHLYLKKKNPRAVNLCQVHLLAEELFAELGAKGLELTAGQMGENVTTTGIDLLALSRGTLLHLGQSAVIEVTGLRTPCRQMDGLRPGLMKACLAKGPRGEVVRRAGVMGVALVSGVVRPRDALRVEAPQRFVALGPV